MADGTSKVDAIALDVTETPGRSDHEADIDKSTYEPTAEAQQGVRDVEAVTLTWTRESLITAFLR